MPISNFRVVACPRGEADQDDLDETSPTGFRLTPEQQAQLDRANRLLERESQLLAVITAVVMGVPVKTDYAIELLEYIEKGAVEVTGVTGHTWAEREALRYAKLKAEIIAQIREETGEIVEADDAAVLAELEGLTETVELVNYLAERVKRQEAEAVGLKAQADAYALPLYDKATKLEGKAASNRKRLLNIPEMVGQAKLGRIGKKVAGNKPIHWLVDEKDLPAKLPARFWTQPETPKPKPDKLAIAKALRNPETAEDLKDVAVFGNGTPTLTID